MAFSSSTLSIEQVTFEANDTRCSTQSINSFESLVSFESEFPKKNNLVNLVVADQSRTPVVERKQLKELKLFDHPSIDKSPSTSLELVEEEEVVEIVNDGHASSPSYLEPSEFDHHHLSPPIAFKIDLNARFLVGYYF